MVGTERGKYRRPLERRSTEAEDAALALSIVVVAVLGLTLLTLLLFEFFEFLPGGLNIVACVSLVVIMGVVIKALLSRALSTPSVYRGPTPIVRVGTR
jgi:hypothetical protein